MRAKRGEIQIFSTSFLDLLTCAMGAFLLLYFAQVLLSQQKDTQAQQEIQAGAT